MKDPKKQLSRPSQAPQQSQRKQNSTSNKDSTSHPQGNKEKKHSQIEDIFKSVKKQKQIQKAVHSSSEQEVRRRHQEKMRKKLKKQWKMEAELRQANDGNMPATNKTEGGIKIYSEEELNIGKGGNTKLCPIDCSCCF